MFIKWWKLGMVIDGVNVVITGRAMSIVTFHGYKNKVKQNYPSATFDVQLVREGDEFKVSKRSGQIEYTHEITSPFEDKPIVGAYCLIDIDGKQYFESLNMSDYQKMKQNSKNKSTWDTWESEFVLKSVIKRACKRHFYDIVADIDQQDNQDYGLETLDESVKANEDKKAKIIAQAKANADNS